MNGDVVLESHQNDGLLSGQAALCRKEIYLREDGEGCEAFSITANEHLEIWLRSARECDALIAWHAQRTLSFARIVALFSKGERSVESAAVAFLDQHSVVDRSGMAADIMFSPWSRYFALMVALGFFKRKLCGYRLVIPPKPTIDLIVAAITLVLSASGIEGSFDAKAIKTAMKLELADCQKTLYGDATALTKARKRLRAY
jgi:hypothetical protein